MKPHEQEWQVGDSGQVMGTVVDAEQRSIAFVGRAGGTPQETARFIAAAPPMARALMAFLPEGGHSMECGNISDEPERCSEECRNARAALKAAGVLHD